MTCRYILLPSWSTRDTPAAIDVSISLLCLNQAFCLTWVWLQVQQRGRQRRESTNIMIPSALNWVGSVFHWWWRHLVHREEQLASAEEPPIQ